MAQRPDRMTLSMPQSLVRKVRQKAIGDGTTVSAVVQVLLAAWLDGKIELPGEEEAKS